MNFISSKILEEFPYKLLKHGLKTLAFINSNLSFEQIEGNTELYSTYIQIYEDLQLFALQYCGVNIEQEILSLKLANFPLPTLINSNIFSSILRCSIINSPQLVSIEQLIIPFCTNLEIDDSPNLSSITGNFRNIRTLILSDLPTLREFDFNLMPNLHMLSLDTTPISLNSIPTNLTILYLFGINLRNARNVNLSHFTNLTTLQIKETNINELNLNLPALIIILLAHNLALTSLTINAPVLEFFKFTDNPLLRNLSFVNVPIQNIFENGI